MRTERSRTRIRFGSILAPLALISVFGGASNASAQLSLTSLGQTETIDFAGFSGTGLKQVPNAGQLDSDWWSLRGVSDGDVAFGSECTTGDCARGSSTGGVTDGGVYSFDLGAGNTGLGV